MAISASNSTTLYADNSYVRATLVASFTENSTSTNDNTSTLSLSASQTINASDWYVSTNSTLQIIWFDDNENTGGRVVASVSRTYQNRNETISCSGTLTVPHKANGKLKGYAKAVWTSGGGYSTVPYSGSVQTADTDLTEIPRAAKITSAPTTFTDESDVKINYNNKAGSAVSKIEAAIYDDTGSTAYASYRDVTVVGASATGTYTFQLTAAEQAALQAASANLASLPVRIYLRTTLNGNYLYDYASATVTIANANPTFTASYADTNSATLAITNDDQQIIQNHSTLVITASNLTALKSATIASAVATVNGVDYAGTISGTTATFNIGTLNLTTTATTVTVTDSRGNSTTESLDLEILSYQNPSAIVSAERHNNYYANTDILADGNISSLDSKNTMTLRARYKKTTDNTWSSYITLTDNVATTVTLDNTYTWDIQVVISDAIATTTYNAQLAKGLPIIFFDIALNSVGVNCFPTGTNTLEVNGNRVLDESDLPLGTNDIANNAVTSDKIDFTTFYDVLYNSTGSGTNGNVTLSASAADYIRLKIFLRDSDGNRGFVEVYNPNGQRFSWAGFTQYGNYVYVKHKFYNISGSSINSGSCGEYSVTTTGAASANTNNLVYITRVEGWKF